MISDLIHPSSLRQRFHNALSTLVIERKSRHFFWKFISTLRFKLFGTISAGVNLDDIFVCFICPHCLKTVFLHDLEFSCPFCDQHFPVSQMVNMIYLHNERFCRIFGFLAQTIIYNACWKCGKPIRYISCPCCLGIIDLFGPYNRELLERKRYE